MKYRELVETRSDGKIRPISERAAVQNLLYSAACASCGSVDLCVYAWETDHFYCSQACRAAQVSPVSMPSPSEPPTENGDDAPVTGTKGRKKK